MLLSLSATFAQEKKKVAILQVVDKEGKLSYADKLMIRSNMARAITNIEGYEAYNRTDIDAVLDEHGFQRSGLVSDDEIKEIEKMTGATYILKTEGTLSRNNNMFVEAQIINIQTLQIEVTDNKSISLSSDSETLRDCRALASKMFGVLAGASTTTNKFMQLFKGKQKSAAEQAADSIAAAKKAEQAAAVAAAKEQQRLEEERIRQERADAEAKVRREREDAEARVREQKRLEQERKEAEEAERAKYFISRLNNHEFLYMNKTMNKKEYSNFLKNNCPEAFSQYKSGKKLIGAGWALFGVGLAATAGGGVGLALVGETSSSSSDVFMVVTVSTILSVGSAMTLASIPMLGVGYSRCKKSVKTYNNKCASPDIQPLSLNLTAGQNGLGLALNF